MKMLFALILISLGVQVCEAIPHQLTPNLALHGTATQSSTYSTYTAQFANDGDLRTDSVGSCAITDSDAGAWWQVDLLDTYLIVKVAITTVQISYWRLVDFYIDVSNNSDGSSAQQCAYDPIPYEHAESRVYTCRVPILGRYVRIRFPSNKAEFLQLCEVQVTDFDRNVIHDQLPPNLGLYGEATQSSTFTGLAAQYGAQYAIDGNFGTDLNAGVHCAVTAVNPGAWWQVDLLGTYQIEKVSVTTMMQNAFRLADFYIDVSIYPDGSSAQQCAYDAMPYLESETRSYFCPQPLLGRYVRIRFPSHKTDHLQLCEVVVAGSVAGHEIARISNMTKRDCLEMCSRDVNCKVLLYSAAISECVLMSAPPTQEVSNGYQLLQKKIPAADEKCTRSFRFTMVQQ